MRYVPIRIKNPEEAMGADSWLLENYRRARHESIDPVFTRNEIQFIKNREKWARNPPSPAAMGMVGAIAHKACVALDLTPKEFWEQVRAADRKRQVEPKKEQEAQPRKIESWMKTPWLNEEIKLGKLTRKELALYGELLDRSKTDTDTVIPISRGELAELVKVNTATVYSIIKKFAAEGRLKITDTKGGRGKTARYSGMLASARALHGWPNESRAAASKSVSECNSLAQTIAHRECNSLEPPLTSSLRTAVINDLRAHSRRAERASSRLSHNAIAPKVEEDMDPAMDHRSKPKPEEEEKEMASVMDHKDQSKPKQDRPGPSNFDRYLERRRERLSAAKPSQTDELSRQYMDKKKPKHSQSEMTDEEIEELSRRLDNRIGRNSV